MNQVIRLTQESAERYMKGKVACPRCGHPMLETSERLGMLCRGCGQTRVRYLAVGRHRDELVAKAEAWHPCSDCDNGLHNRSMCRNCAENVRGSDG